MGSGLLKPATFKNWASLCIALFIGLDTPPASADITGMPTVIVLEAYPITKGHPSNTQALMEKMHHVLSKVGLAKAKITFYPWNRGLDLLKVAKNTLVFPIDKAAGRYRSFKWVAPLLNVNLVMVSKNSDIKSVFDAAAFDRILVRHNSNYEHILRQFGFSNIVPVATETMHQMLSHDRAEGWFTSDIEAQQITSFVSSLSISDTLGVQKMWIAATPDIEDEIVQKIRNALNAATSTTEVIKTQNRELNIASVNNVDMQILEELSSLYLAKNPDMSINWNMMSENRLREIITTDILSSTNEFDLVTIGPYEVAGWGRKGWLQTFDNLPLTYDLADIFDHLNQSLSFEGQLLALPFYSETLLTYYRRDLMSKANISMPSAPTYLEIAKIAAALHNPKEGIYGICLRGLPGWGQNMSLITSLLGSFGGRWFSDDWYPQITSPQWKRAVKYYVNLMQNYGPPNTSLLGHADVTKMFSDGKCGIWIDASVFSSLITDPKRSKVHDKVGIISAPHQETDRTHWLWYWAFAVPKNAAHQTDAMKFAQWATSKEYISAVAQKYGWRAAPPGTRRSTYNADYENEAPYAVIIKQTLEKTGAYPVSATPLPTTNYQFIDIPEFQLIATYAGKVIGQMLDKKISIERGLNLIQKKSTEIMVKAGYIKND